MQPLKAARRRAGALIEEDKWASTVTDWLSKLTRWSSGHGTVYLRTSYEALGIVSNWDMEAKRYCWITVASANVLIVG